MHEFYPYAARFIILVSAGTLSVLLLLGFALMLRPQCTLRILARLLGIFCLLVSGFSVLRTTIASIRKKTEKAH